VEKGTNIFLEERVPCKKKEVSGFAILI